LIDKENGDLEKALDDAGKTIKNKPAFKKLKKLRNALGLKPSSLPEPKDLAEGSLKDAEIEKAVKDLLADSPGLFDVLDNYKKRLDNSNKALDDAEKNISKQP